MLAPNDPQPVLEPPDHSVHQDVARGVWRVPVNQAGAAP